MRGFITFVLAAVFVLIALSFYHSENSADAAMQVQKLEKKYYFEMDVKRAIGESVRNGAREAEMEFAKCAAEGNCRKGLQELMREKMGARIGALAQYLEGNKKWNVVLWCGKTSEEELLGIAQELGNSGAGASGAAICAQCKSAEEGCGEFVDVDLARRVVRLQKGEIFFRGGEFSAVGFGASEKNGETSFEAYFPPWVEIGY